MPHQLHGAVLTDRGSRRGVQFPVFIDHIRDSYGLLPDVCELALLCFSLLASDHWLTVSVKRVQLHNRRYSSPDMYLPCYEPHIHTYGNVYFRGRQRTVRFHGDPYDYYKNNKYLTNNRNDDHIFDAIRAAVSTRVQGN
jgi:hypothetical protein